MESWMMVQGAGALVGLLGLGAVVVAIKKGKSDPDNMNGGKKAGFIGGGVVLMLAGVFLVGNATAFVGPDVTQANPDDDFDAPLGDDDFDAPLDDDDF